ncbi:unnamed protein product [Microthlaspi erraticum]|uniref:Cytochrome P450 n=1 Tax=Microthlaspi erraticum TaxID=1685480 RepID=A0A6D2I3Z6_9BRAS|nr:unnamed protein product [Microthlaspi erraticum]
MEMILLSLCFTTLLAFSLLKKILDRTATSKANLPPSPWRLPVIGNLHQLSLYPHRSLRSLSRRHGPLMLLHFGSVPVLIVSSAEVAHEVMKTHDLKFANRPIGKVTMNFLKGGRNLLLSPYGEYWRQMKSLCVLHLLSNKMVRSFEKLREEELNMMMEKLEKASSSSSSVNLSETIFNMVNTVDIFIAGTTTTSTLLEWTMTELIRHPETMKKLQEDIRTHSRSGSYVTEEEIGNMKYLKAVIKETLRIHPPAPILIPRQLSEDVKLKGYDIAAGTQVIINAWTIQRDSATWGSDAEEFKPERHLDSALDFQGQNFMYIPFGSGRRQCPGIGFAMALAEVALANLVNRFSWKVEARTVGDDDQYHLAEAFGVEVCRKFPLIAFPSSL